MNFLDFFLEIIEKWPLFGAAFFFVKRIVNKSQTVLDCVLAINKDGVRILTNQTHELILHYRLNEVIFL